MPRGGIARLRIPRVAATRFFVIAGVLELGTALMTRWDERDEISAE
jgi:hypothetical protein